MTDICEFFDTEFCNINIKKDKKHFIEYCNGFYKPCVRYDFATQRKVDKLIEDKRYENGGR